MGARIGSNLITIDGDIAYIHLFSGHKGIVDAVDADLIRNYRWGAHKTRPIGGKLYVRTSLSQAGGVPTKYMYLHRLLTNAQDGTQVDHIDGNTLDNRRSNLRLATPSQNNCNRILQTSNKSGFKGACFVERLGLWVAYISVNNKRIYLGATYLTGEDAARAYDTAARSLHGSFARLNFPLDGELPIVNDSSSKKCGPASDTSLTQNVKTTA